MNAYDKLKEARSQSRPTASAYIERLFTSQLELHGDRCFGDDPAMLGGVALLGALPVTYIATERGSTTDERIKRNFGCPKPEGYRKAKRLMLQAEKFRRPVIALIDTSGAFCGVDAEERGQGQAIADNLELMSGLRTPVIALLIGEGESGGALGIAVADRVYMLNNAIYSVISPEGCASILWKDSTRAPEMAENLKLTAAHMKKFGVADRVIEERFDAFDDMCADLRQLLEQDLRALMMRSDEELRNARYMRFRQIGEYISSKS